MSTRTKKSCVVAASRTRRRLSTDVARSTVSPSWVSFKRDVAADAGAGDRLDDRRGTRASPGRPPPSRRRSRRDSRASASCRAASTSRAAAIASSTVSPAMNRRAKLSGLSHPVAGGKGLEASAAGEWSGRTPSRPDRSSVGAWSSPWAREEVLQRSCVVAQHGPFAHPEQAAALDMDDAAVGQQRRAELHRLAAGA